MIQRMMTLDRVMTTIQLVALAALLLFTIANVATSWTEVDGWLGTWTVLVSILSFGGLLAMRRSMKIVVVDLFIAGWWGVEAVACYLGYGMFTPSAFISFVQWGLLYFSLRLLFSLNRLDAWWLIGGLLLCGMYESLLGCWQLSEGYSRHSLFPITGSFLNPGPYSAYIAIGMSVAFVLLFSIKKDVPCGWRSKMGMWLATGMLLMGMVVLPMTWSRAALVAVAIVTVSLFWSKVRNYKLLLTIGILVMLVFLYGVKLDSANSRLLMWQVSLHNIVGMPWLGAGIGGFPQAYAEGMASYFTSNPTSPLLQTTDVSNNAFCEILTIGVEQGVPGMLIFVGMITLSIRWLRRESPSLACGLLALVVFSLFSYPFHTLPYRVLLALFCAYAASGETRKSLLPSSRWLVVVMMTVLLPIGVVALGEIRRRISATVDYETLRDIDSFRVIDDYYDLLPLMDDNVEFLFDFGKVLSQKGRYNDSNDILRRGTSVSADPMFHVVMGNNYMEMRQYSSAKQCYRRAYDILPNRMYPLYKLMKLYEKQGHTKQCLVIAHEIVDFDEKITSEAIRQMKDEADKTIKSYGRK